MTPTMKTPSVRAALVAVLFATTLILRAEPPGGTPQPVPAALPSADRVQLGKWRTKIMLTQTLFEGKHQAVLAEYAGITDDDPRAGQARAAKEALESEANGIIDQVDNYTETLGLGVKIQDESRRITEAEEQLRGFGFKQREADFVRYGGWAGQARDRLIAQLTLRVQTLVTAKAEALMQERFLEQIGKMKPKDVNRLAEKLMQAGAKDPLFQEWLRSYSPKASRQVLIEGAKEAIACLKYEEKLFKLTETDTETVAGRQEAVLTLASMLIDHPYLKELSAVAAGIYDVGEAGATLWILNEGVDHLNGVVDQQLADQKKTVQHMTKLVTDRKAHKARYAELLPK